MQVVIGFHQSVTLIDVKIMYFQHNFCLIQYWFYEVEPVEVNSQIYINKEVLCSWCKK